jgi:triacylglycerol lipase
MMWTRLAVTSLFLGGCLSAPAGDDVEDFGGGKADGSWGPTRLPIVLAHGFNASPTHNGFNPDIVKALCADGHAVFAPAVPPFASVETRGAALAKAIDGVLAGATDACGVTPETPPAQVNIIAHSMGGLDARYVISSLGYGDRVATLTTVSTPHRGSAEADMSLGLLASIDADALANFATLLERPLETPDQLAPDLKAAFTALAESSADAFNKANTDDARVKYESWAGLSNVSGIANPQDKPACENKLVGFSGGKRHVMHAILVPIAWVVAHQGDFIPNDGLVQVASAKWGTFRGCVPSDHIDEVGAFPTSITPFKRIPFYRARAFELASRGY